MEALINFFEPRRVNSGVVKTGETVAFLIENKTDYDIWAWSKSCGCLGDIEVVGRNLKCELQAQVKGTPVELYKEGDRYVRFYKTDGGNRAFDVVALRFVDDVGDSLELLRAHEFNQSITIYLDDGEPVQGPNESLELVDNDKKKKVAIPVSMYVIE